MRTSRVAQIRLEGTTTWLRLGRIQGWQHGPKAPFGQEFICQGKVFLELQSTIYLSEPIIDACHCHGTITLTRGRSLEEVLRVWDHDH